MSINLKLHLDEETFDDVLRCCLDDKQTRSDLRLLLVSLFSNVANDFDLQFDRSDRIPLDLFGSHLIEIRDNDEE